MKFKNRDMYMVPNTPRDVGSVELDANKGSQHILYQSLICFLL